ncbi:hypothetical protein Tco_1229632 [Tanacetum coccineum]
MAGDPNHLISECPKPPRDKNQRAFVGGCWSDSGEEDEDKAKDETCLMAQASNEETSLRKELEKDIEDDSIEIEEIVNVKESKDHPLGNVIGNLNQDTLAYQSQTKVTSFVFISIIEPKNWNEALGDESWIVAMQEELNQFIANDVWELVH